LDRAASRRFRWILIAIFVCAFGVRLDHIHNIRDTPFFAWLLGDARSYDAWALRIAGGDWIGRDVFYQAPLYPYFLAAIYRIAGHDLYTVRIVQALIGSASCVLLASAVRRLSGDVAGIVAGFMLALWAPAIFFDSLLQKAVLDVFFVCVIVWLISKVRLKADTTAVRLKADTTAVPLKADATAARGVRLQPDWLALGLAAGALALTRENALVFLFVLLAWALLSPPRLRPAAALSIGAALILTPVAIRNAAVGGGFYLTTSQFGPNFYIGNNARADGTYASLRYGRGAPEFERQDATDLAERASGRRLSAGAVSRYWTDRALDFITTHPIDWLRLLGRKLVLLVNATEMVDTESQESYAEVSWPLRMLGSVTHFGVLVPLAVLGVLLARPRRAPIAVVAALSAAYAVSVLVFYVFGRYRYPLVPLLIVFAAIAIEKGSRILFDSTRRQHLLPALIPVAMVAIVANWPVVPHAWMRAVTETNLGVALQADRRYDDAIARYRRALELRPDYAPAMNNLATAYRAAGRLDDAVAEYRRALEAQPDFPDAQYNLANALLDKGAADEAIDRFGAALRSIPDSVDVHNNLGTALAVKGRTEEAIREFRQALTIDPSSSVAHRNLGNLLASNGDRDGAIEHLRLAVSADPSSGDAHYDLGSALLEAGSYAEAVVELRAAVAQLPDSAEARNNLGIALGSTGKLDDAIEQFREALKRKPTFAEAQRNLETAIAAQRASRARRQP
jgi:tetratricopeptide (TPR) repeat protein